MNISIEEIKNYWDRMRFYDMAKTFGFEKYLTKKEVKKVNKIPYFELKVVKVKKETECQHCYDKHPYICAMCGQIVKKPKRNGNWVNGENLDKIKFPCFCSYRVDGFYKLGFLSVNGGYYYIANIDSQKKIQNDVTDGCYKLKEFIKNHNIHILKGKIIIFEEEK